MMPKMEEGCVKREVDDILQFMIYKLLLMKSDFFKKCGKRKWMECCGT